MIKPIATITEKKEIEKKRVSDLWHTRQHEMLRSARDGLISQLLTRGLTSPTDIVRRMWAMHEEEKVFGAANVLAPGGKEKEATQWSTTAIVAATCQLLEQWREEHKRDIAEHQAKMLRELDAVVESAWKKGHEAVVLKALRQKAKLLGLDAPIRVEHSGDKSLAALLEDEPKVIEAEIVSIDSNSRGAPPVSDRTPI